MLRSMKSAIRLGSRFSRPPAHFVQPHRVVEAQRSQLAAIRKREPLAGEQVANRFRDENVAAFRHPGDTRCEDHGGTEQVAVFFDGLACVPADLIWMRSPPGARLTPVLLHSAGDAAGEDEPPSYFQA